jgi:hypothetical protein
MTMPVQQNHRTDILLPYFIVQEGPKSIEETEKDVTLNIHICSGLCHGRISVLRFYRRRYLHNNQCIEDYS